MKVLIIQENGRHERNRHFRECYSLKRAFDKYGFLSTIWGLGHDNFQSEIDFNYYDIIFNLENYGDGWLPDLSIFNRPFKILWSIDAHCRGVEPYENIFKNGKYNLLLHSTRDFVSKSYHLWFPNAFDDYLIKPIKIKKSIRVGFCGNIVNRGQILDELRNKYGLHLDIFVIGEDMVRAINSYKCHFNMNISNDINYRSFETIGCGTMLLTNYSKVYSDLGFIHNKNCLMYNSIEELHDMVKNIEKYDIQSISDNGYKLSKSHTYDKRIENLLAKIN